MKETIKEMMQTKTKIQSILAVMLVGAFVALFFVGEISMEKVTYLGTFVAIVLQAYFKNKDENKKSGDD